ncbi:MAG: CoA transferase [Acidobacteria bacterium]|nr:MAG: CoA transferase [Acidobacteriota bacterium]REK07089.1 MAG: CoA transferase [Acidobacteriota bacterium]
MTSRPAARTSAGPLAGIRVLDFSRLAPGPYCTMLLGDLGADVVRIDAPRPPVRIYEMLARNKRSLQLDLKHPRAGEVLRHLVVGADVVVEGNRPGVMRRLGADYETLREIEPRLVYCSLTGYGQDGPMAQAAGHDINYIALSGVLSQIGTGDSGPIPPLNLVADYGGGGMLAALGIVAALLERERSGEGQRIDAAMVDGSISLMSAHYSTGGALSRPGSGLLGGGAPFYRCYRCSDGGYVAVGAIEPQFWRALCAGLDMPQLLEDQMDVEQWPQRAAAIAARFATRPRDHWEEVFTRHDACVSPVLDLDEAPNHPHNRARSAFERDERGRLHTAPAPRLSRSPGSVRSPAPGYGEHTLEVLEQLGCSSEVCDGWLQAGVFGELGRMAHPPATGEGRRSNGTTADGG